VFIALNTITSNGRTTNSIWQKPMVMRAARSLHGRKKSQMYFCTMKKSLGSITNTDIGILNTEERCSSLNTDTFAKPGTLKSPI